MPDLSHIPLRTKAPLDVFDVKIRYANWLAEIGNPTIAASTWTVEPENALTLTNGDDHDDTSATVRVAAGTLNTLPLLTNLVTTSDGQQKTSSIRIMIRIE